MTLKAQYPPAPGSNTVGVEMGRTFCQTGPELWSLRNPAQEAGSIRCRSRRWRRIVSARRFALSSELP